MVLAEGEDLRTLKAAESLIESKVTEVTLLGDIGKIQISAAENNIDIKGAAIIDPASSEYENEFTGIAFDRLASKGIDRKEAGQMIRSGVNFGALMIDSGKADACVAGAVSTSAEVARAALRFIGLRDDVNILSSSFLMISPDKERAFTFADCGVVPDPTSDQLAGIAIESAKSHEILTGETPKIAFLSFSTKGSASHERVKKVTDALKNAGELDPRIDMDGEFQFDAALDPAIGK